MTNNIAANENKPSDMAIMTTQNMLQKPTKDIQAGNAAPLDVTSIANILKAEEEDHQVFVMTNGHLMTLETAMGSPDAVMVDLQKATELQNAATGYMKITAEPLLTIVTFRESNEDITKQQIAILEDMMPAADLQHTTKDNKHLLDVVVNNKDHMFKNHVGDNVIPSAVQVAQMVSDLVSTQKKRDMNLSKLHALVA